ncbi:DMT family transporter [Pseudomonas sp. KU26590]|uniref:DMT family transporter n=1 Tax=Pseudomonas sp. KU26590 TaxID=2991051 RepID=UPI00223E56BD|nr:DMT family transporter [Pseudomonas sp. KU26590]UZJ57950.1 DMT family transporter [Pseudomonas sp. KU26590]
MCGKSKLLVFMSLAGAMALWASAFVAIKIALIEVPPFVLMFLRLILGSGFFALFWKFGVRKSIAIKDRWLLLVMSFFEPCLYFILETKALQYTSASQAGVVFAFLPVLIMLFSYLIYHDKPSTLQCAGGLLAAAGVLVLCLTGSHEGEASAPVLGNFLELLAMACAAIYTVLLKRLTGMYSPFLLAAIQSFTGAIFFLPFAAYEAAGGISIGLNAALAVLYLGLIVTAAAYTLFNYGISKVSVAQGALYFNLVPIFTLLFSVAFLEENIYFTQVISMALVIAGVMLGLAKTTAVKTVLDS